VARAVGRGWMRSSADREDVRVHLMKVEQLGAAAAPTAASTAVGATARQP
jgi:hypothetical protein